MPVRMRALTVIGRLRARRGEADPWTPLDEALELAVQHGEPQELCPVSYARAEAAWLEGDDVRARSEAARGLDAARHAPKEPWWRGRAHSGRGRAGTTVLCPRTRRSLTHSTSTVGTRRRQRHGGRSAARTRKRSRSPTAPPRRTFAQRSSCSASSVLSRWHAESPAASGARRVQDPAWPSRRNAGEPWWFDGPRGRRPPAAHPGAVERRHRSVTRAVRRRPSITTCRRSFASYECRIAPQRRKRPLCCSKMGRASDGR